MDNPSLSKKYQLPNNDFINFGYSCVDTTQCESMLQMYVNSNDDDSDNYIDVKQRVSCYTNDAPDGNAINHQSSSQFHADQGIAYKDELNSSFCACRVDYGWQGPLCDIPSNRSKNASYLFFALFAFMIILIFYRGRLSFKAWKAKVLRKNDARGFTMKTTMFAHSIFAPLSALSYAIYYLIGPGVGKTSEGIRIFQSVTYQICIALTLLSMLILLLAFIEIATSMKQLKGFQRARYPIIALSIFFFVSQMALFFSGRGNDAIYITIAMIAILVILVLIGPGWMFFKFSASLLHERSKVFSPNGSAIEEKFGEKKQTFVGGCTDCLRALCEDITRSITGHTDTIQGTDTGGEQSSSNSKNSRSSRDEKATDLVPKPLQVSVNPKDEKDKTQSVKLGSAIITVISKNDPSTRPRADSKESKESKESKDSKESFEMSMIAIRDRAHSKESQSSAGSKDSKTPLNEEQFKAFLQSKRISRGKSKKDIDGSDNSKTDAQAEALKKAMKQNHSDRKVAKFLSRVLQLSIRIGIALLLFILSTVVTIPMGSNYFTLSLNVAALSLLSITRFFQLFYAFIVLDSILWFFSDVLKKEIKKKEGRNSNLGNNGTPVNNEAKRTNENGSKDENAGESLKRFGSKTEISKTSSVVLNANGSFIASKLAQSKEEHVDLDEAVDVVVTGDEAKV